MFYENIDFDLSLLFCRKKIYFFIKKLNSWKCLSLILSVLINFCKFFAMRNFCKDIHNSKNYINTILES